MSDERIHIGGESAEFMSDGLRLHLENGQCVRPRLRSPGENQPWVAHWVNPRTGEAGVGPIEEGVQAILYLSTAKAVFDDDGNRLWHFEWCGWMWCDREDEAFDYPEPGEPECPHCGGALTIPEPVPVEEAP